MRIRFGIFSIKFWFQLWYGGDSGVAYSLLIFPMISGSSCCIGVDAGDARDAYLLIIFSRFLAPAVVWGDAGNERDAYLLSNFLIIFGFRCCMGDEGDTYLLLIFFTISCSRSGYGCMRGMRRMRPHPPYHSL